MSITAQSVNQNAKTRRSNWGTFFWRIQICNKKWGFPFKFLIFPPPPPPGSGSGGSSLVSLDVPLRDKQLSLPTFFYPCIVLEIFQCLQINGPPCIIIY